MTPTNYGLRPGLFFCRTGEHFIFLDIKKSRYFALNGVANAAFGDWVAGRDVQRDALDLLCGLHILTQSRFTGELIPVSSVKIPQISLYESGPTGFGMTFIAGVQLQIAKADVQRQSLPDIIADLKSRTRPKESRQHVDCFGVTSQIGAAVHRTERIISTRDACLAKSIAVMRMLLARGCNATMVFGVRLHPFMAHCWVQNGYGLITDRTDHVESFTPILVI